MEAIAKKVVQRWTAKGYISEEEAEICQYNLICFSFTLTVFCFLILAGTLLGECRNTVIWITSLLFLRTYTNGYHCKSCVACTILSLAATLLSLHIIRLLNPVAAFGLMAIGAIAILVFAPANSPQMHLSEDEIIAMRKRVHTRLLVLAVLFLLLMFFNREAAYCIVMAIAVVATSLLAVQYKVQ